MKNIYKFYFSLCILGISISLTAYAAPIITFVNPTPANNASVCGNGVTVKAATTGNTVALDWNRSLAGWWRFNAEPGESSTLFKDWSSYGNNGACSGLNCPTVVSGKFGKALQFDGVDDYAEIYDADNLDIKNQFTISVWIKKTGSGYTIISKDGVGEDSTGAYNLYVNDSLSVSYETNNSGSISTGTGAVSFNNWHHIAVVFDNLGSPQMRIYIDGVEKKSGNVAAPSSNSQNLLIGRRGRAALSFFKGLIDDVRIYNRPLSEIEVKSIYDAQTDHLEVGFSGLEDGQYVFRAFSQDGAGVVGYTEPRTVSVANCVNICTKDAKRCSSNGVQTCKDVNNDGCYEWTSAVACVAGQSCLSGVCAIDATDDKIFKEDKARLDAVIKFADNVLVNGRDRYRNPPTPLFANGINTVTKEHAKWPMLDGASAIISNLSGQQTLFRTLVALSVFTGNYAYKDSAKATIRYYFDNFVDSNGLLYWGDHVFVDLKTLKVVKVKVDLDNGTHELKDSFPFYELMYEVSPEKTKKFVNAFWNAHIKKWDNFEMSRHGNYNGTYKLADVWANKMNNDLQPMRRDSGNRSFISTGSDLMYAAAKVSQLSGDARPLNWANYLANQYISSRCPETGLGASRFTKTPGDYAYAQFGGNANEGWAMIRANSETTMYGQNAIMQLEMSRVPGGAEGKKLLEATRKGMAAYAKIAYISGDNKFKPMLADGTDLTNYSIKYEANGVYYYGKKGSILHSYPAPTLFLLSYARIALATQDAFLWQTARNMAAKNGLGDIGSSPGKEIKVNLNTGASDANILFAIVDIYDATKKEEYLKLGRVVGNNIVKKYYQRGYFTLGSDYVNSNFDATMPLSILALQGAIDGRFNQVPKYVGGSPYIESDSMIDSDIWRIKLACVPKSCVALGNYECNIWADGCGGMLNCGTCAGGKICSNGQCVNNCASHSSKKCDAGNLHWYNSCNAKEELFQDCGSDQITSNYRCNGSWTQRETVKKGCADSVCTSESTWSNDVNCAAVGKVCGDGVCITQSTGGGGGGGGSGGIIIKKEEPKPVVKMTRDQIITKINEIVALVAKLQAQLKAMAGASTYSCVQITKNLYYDMKNDPQVKCLQEVLQAQGFAVVPTGDYGGITKTAVKQFQEKYAGEILVPYGLRYGSGNVGNSTKNKLNQIINGVK